MDVDIEKRLNDAIESLQKMSEEDISFQQMDPVARMMLVALVSEAQKIQDYADDMAQRIVERFCSDFIPRRKVEATPAVCLLNPIVKATQDDLISSVGSGAMFSYKIEGLKQPLNYIPIFNTTLIPHQYLYILNHNLMKFADQRFSIDSRKPNRLWVGIRTDAEIECLKGLSIFIKGTKGIVPEHIYAGADGRELDFATILEMENIEMAEPFDAQQASGQMFSFIESWKESMLNMDDATLIYITDKTNDRDTFKPRAYPRDFQQWLESEKLDSFQSNTVWLRLDFPEEFTVPETCEIILNVIPVTNIDVCSLMLTQSQPIAKLQKLDESFFLQILETTTSANQQGFNTLKDEIIVRDFDATCYDNGALYREVRTLYNHFIDDYYAFIEYNGIKDGEVLKQLRETINKLGKSVGTQNAKFNFNSGTYVMKNMNQYPPTSSTKVSYITTQGRIGNTPREGQFMDNRRLPALEQKVPIVVSGMGGMDKASADERYEQLRYYSLTNDRLYTRMDVDAFLRKEIMAEFGKEEFRRIFIKTSIGGAAGSDYVHRGLYVDIEFKDKKNYMHADEMSFDNLMRQKIINKSCIAMPIIVTLKNLED